MNLCEFMVFAAFLSRHLHSKRPPSTISKRFFFVDISQFLTRLAAAEFSNIFILLTAFCRMAPQKIPIQEQITDRNYILRTEGPHFAKSAAADKMGAHR